MDESVCHVGQLTESFLSLGDLIHYLDHSNSNVCRHTSTGIPTACSSLRSAAETAKELAGDWFKSGEEAFHATFGSDEADLVNAPKVLNARGEGSESTTEQRKAALRASRGFCKKNKAKSEAMFGKMAASDSRMYSGAMNGLGLLAMTAHPAVWAKKVHDGESDNPSLRKWKARPEDEDRLVAEFSASFVETDREGSTFEWQDGFCSHRLHQPG